MNRVIESIYWDGITPVVSLFLASCADAAPDLGGAWGVDAPQRTKVYRLEDDRETATLRVVFEYDFEFETLPVNLKQCLENCLQMACAQNDAISWLAFEGSFHFDHILEESIANQIYGVCATGDEPVVALDDDEETRIALRERLRNYRMRLAISHRPTGTAKSNPPADR